MAPSTAPDDAAYQALLAEGAALFPDIRIGRPGRSRGVGVVTGALKALRLGWHVDLDGAQHVRPGAAVLVANHVSALDPVMAVMATGWKVTAFAKSEVFHGPGAPFFRWMGQIPLRRGDPRATDWALRMATATLRSGGRIGVYPEGTRSPHPDTLHKLHGRVLLAVLRDNPDVPVHALTTRYTGGRGRRRVQVRISPRLPYAPATIATLTDDEIMTMLREELLRLGGQTYRDESAYDVKRALRNQ